MEQVLILYVYSCAVGSSFLVLPAAYPSVSSTSVTMLLLHVLSSSQPLCPSSFLPIFIPLTILLRAAPLPPSRAPFLRATPHWFPIGLSPTFTHTPAP